MNDVHFFQVIPDPQSKIFTSLCLGDKFCIGRHLWMILSKILQGPYINDVRFFQGILNPLNIKLDVIYERSFARFFFVLDLQKNFRCIVIDCKYFSSFFSDISTIIGREKSRKLFLKEKKARKNFGSTFLQKSDTILLHQHAK